MSRKMSRALALLFSFLWEWENCQIKRVWHELSSLKGNLIASVRIWETKIFLFSWAQFPRMTSMVRWVVVFLDGVYKMSDIFAQKSTYRTRAINSRSRLVAALE